MLGVVRRGDGGTVSGANVVFAWTDIAVEKSTLKTQMTRMTASATTDSVGVYRACGLPAGIALYLQAQRGANEQSVVIEPRAPAVAPADPVPTPAVESAPTS